MISDRDIIDVALNRIHFYLRYLDLGSGTSFTINENGECEIKCGDKVSGPMPIAVIVERFDAIADSSSLLTPRNGDNHAIQTDQAPECYC